MNDILALDHTPETRTSEDFSKIVSFEKSPQTAFMGVERIFSRGDNSGFFQRGTKVVKFHFSNSKLRK